MMTTLLRRAFLTILTAAFWSVAAQAAEVRGRIMGEGGKPVAHALVRVIPDVPATAKPA